MAEFEQVDINSFFDSTESTPAEPEKTEFLTKKQKSLIEEAMPLIREKDPEKAKQKFTQMQTGNMNFGKYMQAVSSERMKEYMTVKSKMQDILKQIV